MNHQQQCPDDRQWEELLLGALPAEQQTPVLAHLEACDDCRQRLEERSGGRDRQ